MILVTVLVAVANACQKQMKGGCVYLCSQSQAHGEKSWQEQLEAAACTASTVKRPREMNADAQLVFPFTFSSELQSMDWYLLNLGRVFPPPLNQLRALSQTSQKFVS